MKHERIFLNGAPVSGFGATEEEEKKFYGTMIGFPLIGTAAGIAGGSILGYAAKKGPIVTAVGALAGGVAGGAGGILLAKHSLRRAAQERGIGVGSEEATATSDPSPWALTFAGSVLAAATGWALDEFARTVRERRRP